MQELVHLLEYGRGDWLDIVDALGITRKQQMKDDQSKSAHEIMDGIVDVIGGLVEENEGYDPDSFD